MDAAGRGGHGTALKPIPPAAGQDEDSSKSLTLSLTRLIEEGLQMRLRAQAAPPCSKLRLPVFKGRGGLVAAVNPLSNKAQLKAWGDDA